MNGDCVVDASVAIKLFVVEADSDRAIQLFERLTEDQPARFYIPDLFYIECANILYKYVRRFGYAADSAKQDVADLAALDLIVVSTADLLESALHIALTYVTTAYDGCYVALAQQLSLPLVTADAPLARKMKGSDVTVQTLDQLNL